MIKEKIDRFRYGKIMNNINRSDYLEFKDVNGAEEWGKKHYLKWSEEYKRNMHIANNMIKDSCVTSVIEFYCGYSHRDINEYLRFDRDDKYNSGREMANALALMLSMAPRVPNNIVAYRLVCDDVVKKIIENNKQGIPTIEKGFISTSLVKDIVNSDEAYSKHSNLLKIYIPKNTVGIYVNGIDKRTEEELLLFPNGYFKLIRSPYSEGNKKVYECQLFYFNH
jgi:hypothetical protein